jgi:hypothetical protein
LPDRDDAIRGAARVSSPRFSPSENPQKQASRELREAAERLPADRLKAAVEWVEQAAGRARAAHGGEVMDDLADLDLDDPMYLILDEQGGCDDE